VHLGLPAPVIEQGADSGRLTAGPPRQPARRL